MTITKSELALDLRKTLGVKQNEALLIVNAFIEALRDGIVVKSELKLSGFGSFIVRGKVARVGRNPISGQTFVIKARRVVTFKASPILRARCNPNLPSSLHLKISKITPD